MEKHSSDSNKSAVQPLDSSYLPTCNGKRGPEYLKWVSDNLSKNSHFRLKSPRGASLKIGTLEDTIYSEKHDEVNGWGKFYLPGVVTMHVVGIVKGVLCPCEQLVMMTCEDGKLYAFDGEELHVVASSMEQLRKEGIEYPASTSYYDGEAFKDMTEEDWAVVRKGAVGKKLDEEHHKLVTSRKSRFLENLKLSRDKRGTYL
ncbi:uncharacterized protein [Brachyistius frenatus]|uniref:uncharacterized protein isoform X2 n=1 Tax=Brachyistius frenatus TaxID=100188 RepID=UPI0037E93173